MKKFLVMFLLLAIAGFALADVYTIGTGTSTENYVPFYGLYDYGWSKTIYTAAEINAAGLTTASSLVGIGFDVGNTPSNYTMLDQRVYLRTTTQSVYETADVNLPDNTQFTSVYQGSLTYNGGGWAYVMFSAPFAWDGTSNIEILWENWDGDYVSGYPNFRYTTTTPDYRSVYKYADTTFPATLAGTRYYNRPNIQFATPQTTPPNAAVAIYPTMNGYAFTDATLSWQSGGGMPTSYDVYFGTANPPTTLVSDNQVTTSYTPAAALAPATTYYWQIIPSNNIGPAVGCPVWSFNTPQADQLAESFNDTTFPPAGWANPGTFTRSTTTPFHGLASAYKSAPVTPALLSTPMLSMVSSSSLNFWARTSATTGNGRIQIQYSPDRVTWTNIGDIISLPTTVNWVNYSVDLSSLAGNNYYLAFAVSSVTSTTAIYIDHVFGPGVTPLLPDAVTLTAPANAAINVSAMPTLTWAPGTTGGVASSYKVYMDTNADPSTLVATVPTASYTVTTALPYNSTYYWKVVAHNAAGDAPASSVFSFTVMSNPTVSTFPWTVNFGTVAADWPVLNWTQLSGLYGGTYTSSAQWFQDDWLNVTGTDKAAKINIYGTSRYGWLITPPIALPATGYTLKFDAALMVWNGTTAPTTTQDDDRFIVVMSDSPLMTNPTIIREWNNTGSPFVFNSIPAAGTNISIPLGNIVGTKYFAFYGESTVTGNGDNDLMIDNVVIEFVTEIPAFTVSPTSHNYGNVTVGQTASQAFTVSNSGTGTLVINSVALSGSPMMAITGTLPTFPVSLTAGQTMAFTVTYAPTAPGVHNATITIVDNLARQSHTVALTGTGTEVLNPPTNLTATVTGSNVALDWDAPGTTPPPTGFTDGFETYENFALTFAPWTTVDVDQSTTYGMTGITWTNAYAAQAYMIFNPSATTPAVTDLATHSGAKMAASFASTTPPNNDWMMSPPITIAANDVVKFWARSYVSTYGLERFKVGVSTTGTAPANFTIISGTNYIQAPITWTEYTYALNAYAGQTVRIGIQCLSNDAFIFCVDDFFVGQPAARGEIIANAQPVGTNSRETGVAVATTEPTRALTGYKVYRDGTLITTITDPATTAYADNGLATGTYVYTVTATYTGGESVPTAPATAVVSPAVLQPPTNLTATVVSNDVTLDWDNPVPPAAGDWITWAQDVVGNSVGTNAAAQFAVAHRWTAADLAPYAGRTLTQIKFVPAYESCTYTVKVWTGGSATNAGTLVSSQVVPTFTIGEWNLVILTTPVPIPATGELWYGFEVNTTGGYPAGCDDGPPIEGKGNMMYFQGAWTTLTALAPTLTYNWSVKAFAQSGAAAKAVELKPIAESKAAVMQTGDLAAHRYTPTAQTRAINGYKVYRDGVLISTITNPDVTTYLDLDLANATYNYGVSATYTNGESTPATVQAVVNVTLAPAFFTDGFETYPDFANLFSPWTLIDVDQSGTYGITNIEFPGSAAPMAYIVFNPSATTPPITTLTPHGGVKMAASFAATAPPNNDWMITPRVHLGTGSAIKFYARSHVATYGLERFRIGVNTMDTPTIQGFSYVTGPNYVEAPVAWTEYIYDLSQYDNQNVYIGIRCVSNDAFVFYVDDFAIHSNGGSVGNDDNTAPVLQNALIGNYPNPFNPETTIRFSTATSGPVNLGIYNLKGQLVKTLVNESKASGNHSAVWNGMDDHNRPVASGVYYYKMQAGKFSDTRKMILMK